TLSDLPIDYNFKYVTRYDRCTTCHLGADRPSYAKPNLRALGQEPSEQLLAWLDDESVRIAAAKKPEALDETGKPMPEELTGHSGQGSATEFTLASHTPDDTPQKNRWSSTHHWESNHFWDFPMLPKRFLESGCVKCHYHVTDLLPDGNKMEVREGKKVDAPG